jgi:N-acetylglucosaminyl-diphospho-decaprenol L-rhamnosyltransferase
VLVGPDNTPDVSVIVVLWNCAPFLEACTASLERSSVVVEVLCFDNASADGSADIAERLGCTVIRSTTNLGFPAAVNRLLPLCRAPLTLLLNPDVELADDAVTQSIRALQEPGVGMVGANLRRPDGTPDPPAARRFRSVGTIFAESLGLGLLHRRLDVQYLPSWDRSTSRDVPCINGAFMLLPTSTLHEAGGLDESVFLYLEDQELCRAIADRGERIRFVADARATHVGGGPTEASSPEQRAAAYLHRLDASLEIVRRRQGRVARLVALVVLVGRSASQWMLGALQHDDSRKLKHRGALRWLARQLGGRQPPPAVP